MAKIEQPYQDARNNGRDNRIMGVMGGRYYRTMEMVEVGGYAKEMKEGDWQKRGTEMLVRSVEI